MSFPRVWLVTGTSSGIGRSLVEAVLLSGERVVATLRNSNDLLDLSALYPVERLLVLELDVLQQVQIQSAFAKAKAHFGRVDVVVNNAGYGVLGEVEATSDDDARHQLEVNFWGPVRICREAVRFYREENPPGLGGRILNISSTGGFSGNPALAFYSASKFALEGFSESLAMELPPSWNIKLTIVEPGGFRTEWNKGGLVKLPIHPAYTVSDAPSPRFRPLVTDFKHIGDPARAATALIKISQVNDPPLRLALGPDAILVIRSKCESVLADLKEWHELSVSTLAADADAHFFLKALTASSV